MCFAREQLKKELVKMGGKKKKKIKTRLQLLSVFCTDILACLSHIFVKFQI